jgi:hypothetical protein
MLQRLSGRFWAVGRLTGNCPEAGFEDIAFTAVNEIRFPYANFTGTIEE